MNQNFDPSLLKIETEATYFRQDTGITIETVLRYDGKAISTSKCVLYGSDIQNLLSKEDY
jgi:hypothetical protein